MWLFNSERTRVVKGFKKSVCEKLNEVQDLLTSDIAVIHVLIEEGYLKPIIKDDYIGYLLFIKSKSFAFIQFDDGSRKAIAYHFEGDTPIGIIIYDMFNHNKAKYLDGYTDKNALSMLCSLETHLENFIGYTKSADFLTKLNKKIKENKTK